MKEIYVGYPTASPPLTAQTVCCLNSPADFIQMNEEPKV